MMRPGPLIRGLFGPYERTVTEAYRRFFVDLDDFVERLLVWVPQPRRILEVGCGEGAITERLSRADPHATVTGIDITSRIGRLYRGDAARVRFFPKSIEDVARDEPASFDLVVLCDVLHHVPPPERQPLLAAINRAMTREGSLAVKDWIVSTSPIHWLCSISDRYLTGDDVNFFTVASAKTVLTTAFGPDAIRGEALVRPWSNNVAFLVRRYC
jgi:2-polyprenyl-6-hydroxyphenyl methylase/3-demethylubiquinone-9 3-methyltransferase